MPYKDKIKKRKFDCVYRQKRKLDWLKKNGPCQKCGTWENLEIDHKDPTTKEFNPSKIWTRRKEVREKELSKCQALCRECHRVKTLSQTYIAPCGTKTKYDNGCRCFSCTKAAVDDVNEWRWRTGRRIKGRKGGRPKLENNLSRCGYDGGVTADCKPVTLETQ